MNDKVYAIVTKKEKEVIEIKTLLFKLAKEMKFDAIGKGAFKSLEGIVLKNGRYVKEPPRHSEEFVFKMGNRMIGLYEFDLQNNVYSGIINLRGFPEPMYEQIMERLQLQFPRLFPQYSRA